MLDELAGQLQRLGSQIADIADALGLTAAGRYVRTATRGHLVLRPRRAPIARRRRRLGQRVEVETAKDAHFVGEIADYAPHWGGLESQQRWCSDHVVRIGEVRLLVDVDDLKIDLS